MTDLNMLPTELYAAFEWISTAGEWNEALENPIEYARAATINAAENGVFDVTETDLLAVIEWQRGRK